MAGCGFFRKPNQIDKRLVTPYDLASGRPANFWDYRPAEPPYPDLPSRRPLAWDPIIVRRMLARVAATTGRPWPTAIAGQLDFSECVLHGVLRR